MSGDSIMQQFTSRNAQEPRVRRSTFFGARSGGGADEAGTSTVRRRSRKSSSISMNDGSEAPKPLCVSHADGGDYIFSAPLPSPPQLVHAAVAPAMASGPSGRTLVLEGLRFKKLLVRSLTLKVDYNVGRVLGFCLISFESTMLPVLFAFSIVRVIPRR